MTLRRLAKLAAVSLIACRDAPSTTIVMIPRAVSLTTDETRQLELAQRERTLLYSPVDNALGWIGNDSLVVGHVEAFAVDDETQLTCSGTGLFVVPFGGGGSARPMRVGPPVCDALRSSNDGVLLPDASAIIYPKDVPPNGSQLVRLDLNANASRAIAVNCMPYAREPAVSLDGRRLSFVGLCEGRDQGAWAVYAALITGADRSQVVGGDSVSAMEPAWSPDGTSLVVRLGDETTPPNAQRLAVVSRPGDSSHVLVAGDSPSWSPDGRWIAYIHRDSVTQDDVELRLVRPDGAEVRALFRNRTQTTYARGFGPIREGMIRPPLLWTRDSRGVVFGRAFDRGTSLWYVALDSAGARQITESRQR